MKRAIFRRMGILLALMMTLVVFAGCFGDEEKDPPAATEYTIQYTDDAGTHTLKVEGGMPYSLESVPYRFGYEFLGLFDAQAGGKQYVGANGASLAPYADGENKVLFPQFKPIDYTVILDYGDGEVTGERSLTVAYSAALPALPKDVTRAHSVFKGWYTEADCAGIQVADAYGNLPDVSVLNETNFKLDDTHRVYLFAGFESEKYAVTFHYEDYPDETVQIAYGTPVSKVVTATRNGEKQAVLQWSTRANDTEKSDIFTGNITGPMDLYAAEWAPVIEFDGDGAEVTPLVARAGDPIALPVPEKPLAKFLRWETLGGQTADYGTMPAASTTLKAVWQAKIEFDENGGEEVADISEAAGTSVTLPAPAREGYLFAGWYTADKQIYTSETMPSEGIALKAGWYKEKTQTVILKKDSSDPEDWVYSRKDDAGESGPKSDWRTVLDLTELIPAEGARIALKVHYDMYTEDKEFDWQGGIYLYDGAVVSDVNFLAKRVDDARANAPWTSYELAIDMPVRSNVLYLCYYAKKLGGGVMDKYTHLYFKNIYAEVAYPDTTYLYL